MMAKLRTWIDALLLAFDARHLEAHRERQEPSAHPVDCVCHRCDETEPEPRSDDDERCPRCRHVDCSPECIAAEQVENNAYSGRRPKKFA